MQEIWKDIVGYENLYLISNYGRLKSINKFIVLRNGELRKLKERIMKPSITEYGYIRYALTKNSKRVLFRAHRLVAEAFIPNPENKPEVNHKFGDKLDNRVSQLEWATASENMRDAYDNGLIKSRKGAKHHNSKLTDDIVLKIRDLYSKGGFSYKDLGRKFNIHYSNIGYIIQRKAWVHI